MEYQSWPAVALAKHAALSYGVTDALELEMFFGHGVT
jgi:hypothetical protein